MKKDLDDKGLVDVSDDGSGVMVQLSCRKSKKILHLMI